MHYIKNIKKNPYLFIILFIAFLIRFTGIFHDLPYSYYGDEQHFIKRAVSFGSGDLNPHWFHKPAFFMYLLFLEYGLYFVVGRLFGIFHSIDDFAISFFRSMGPFLFIGRLTVAISGTGIVFLTYLIGKEFVDRRVGLISALFMAVVLGNVAGSQVVKADVPSAFFTLLSFYFIVRVYNTGRLKYYLLGGISAGLGMATKYYAAVFLPTIIFVHLLRLRKERAPVLNGMFSLPLLSSGIAFIFTYFIASPYNFIDPLGFHQTIVEPVKDLFEINGEHARQVAEFVGVEVKHFVFFKSILAYFKTLISIKAMGIIGAVGLIGFVYSLLRPSLKNLVFLSMPLFFIIIANKVNPFYSQPRHMNPIYPFFAIYAAYLICLVSEGLTRLVKHSKVREHTILIILVLIVVAYPVYSCIRYDLYILEPDTRTIAKRWFEDHIKPGTRILLEEETLKLNPDKRFFAEKLKLARRFGKTQFTVHADKYYSYQMKALGEKTYDITYINFPWWKKKEDRPGVYYISSPADLDMANPLKPIGVMPYEYYKRHGYRYVIVSSAIYKKFVGDNPEVKKDFPSFYRFYNGLFRNGELIKEFRPDRGRVRGPVIKIFRIDENLQSIG